jgi:hypothetical protein
MVFMTVDEVVKFVDKMVFEKTGKLLSTRNRIRKTL